MKVSHWIDEKTKKQYREIIEDSYKALSIFKDQYEKKGHKTWLNLFYGPTNTWMLTVEL